MAPPFKSVSGINLSSCIRMLDFSQGVQSDRQAKKSRIAHGHPRYHVLCNPDIDRYTIIEDLPHLGCTEVVTEQLRQTKTAFLSKEDQNQALLNILRNKIGKEAHDMLDKGNDEVVLKINVDLFMPNLEMREVVEGNRLDITNASSVVLILGHHTNKPDGMRAHVKTFYPTNRVISGGYSIELRKDSTLFILRNK